MKPSGKIDLPGRMRDAPTGRLLAALAAAGIAARFVGGCVRNAVLGLDRDDDIDVAVSVPPDAVMRALEAAGFTVTAGTFQSANGRVTGEMTVTRP